MADRPRAERPDFDRLGDLLPPGASGSGMRPLDTGAASTGGVSAGTGPAAGGVAQPGLLAGDELGRMISTMWAEVAGAEVAGNARPVQFREGRLVVATSSSAWAQTLQLMSPLVVERLNARLGAEVVTKAVFRHAGWDAAYAGGEAGAEPSAERGRAGPAGAPGPARGGLRGRGGRNAAGSPVASAAQPSPGAAALGPGGPGGPGAKVDSIEHLTAEESQALADLEALPLAPAVKDSIREAMKAGFARAREDSGRS